MPMKEPPHPGVSVRRDCLEAFGVSRKQLSALVNGRAGISPEMAIRLDKAFGGGASTWYQLQAAYDMAQALRRAGVGEEREEGGRRDGGLGVGGRTAW